MYSDGRARGAGSRPENPGQGDLRRDIPRRDGLVPGGADREAGEAKEAFRRIRESFRIPDAFSLWEEYRERLTGCVLDEGRAVPGQRLPEGQSSAADADRSLAVLGAGAMNDLDLKRLAARFRTVVLIDSDLSSLEEGLRRYGLEGTGEIRLLRGSLTGITEADAEDFFCALYTRSVRSARAGRLTPEHFLSDSLELLSGLEQRLFRTAEAFQALLPPGGFDTVVCAGLHSQLFSLLTLSWQVLAGSLSEQVFRGPVPAEPVLQRVKEWNGALIPLLDRAVLRAARRRALFGFEYDPAAPVEGAFQGLRDVQGLAAGLEPADSLGLSAEQELSAGQEPPVRLSHLADLTWPFSPSRGRYYTMRILDLWKEDVT